MRKNLMVCGALALALMFVFGCQKRVATQPETPVSVTQQQGQQPGAGADTGTGTVPQQPGGITKSDSVTSQDLSGYVEKKEAGIEDILFDYDKYNVKDSYKPVLQAVASFLQKNAGAKVAIEGHCDERGTNEYNLALGDRRAKAVADALAALGVAGNRMETVSYGEEKPVCTAQTEECWQKNRRAHFVLLQKAAR
ncbi:MAG: hypothetical protein OHK006_06830 [Thermodesulfovibrionales bacterium]